MFLTNLHHNKENKEENQTKRETNKERFMKTSSNQASKSQEQEEEEKEGVHVVSRKKQSKARNKKEGIVVVSKVCRHDGEKLLFVDCGKKEGRKEDEAMRERAQRVNASVSTKSPRSSKQLHLTRPSTRPSTCALTRPLTGAIQPNKCTFTIAVLVKFLDHGLEFLVCNVFSKLPAKSAAQTSTESVNG